MTEILTEKTIAFCPSMLYTYIVNIHIKENIVSWQK